MSAPLGMTTCRRTTPSAARTRGRGSGCSASCPREWSALVDALRAASAPYRSALLDGRTEYLLWQTLAGTWTDDGPISEDRLVEYLTKAMREAKSRTTWTAPDEPYEARGAGRRAAGARSTRRSPSCSPAGSCAPAPPCGQRRSARSWSSSRCPASPDVYQGTEVPSPVLVDPDNRRPVTLEPLVAAPGTARRRRRPARPRRREAAGDLASAAPAAGAAGGVRRPGQRVPSPGALLRALAHLRPHGGRRPAGRRRRHAAGRGRGPARRLGRPLGRAAPRATGTTCSRTGPCVGGVVDVGPLLDRLPVALLVRAEGVTVPPRVWAPTAARVDVVLGDEHRPLTADGELVGRRHRPPARHRLRVLGRRRPAAAGPAQRVAAARRARRQPRLRPHDLRVVGRRVARRSTSAAHVIYELHVGTFTRRGHARRRDRAPRRSWSRSASTSSSSCRWRRSAACGAGATTASRRSPCTSPTAGPPALQRVRRRCARARPRRLPGRRAQPPRPVGQLPRRVRPVLHRRAPDAVGRRDQPRRRRRPTRCAAGSCDSALRWFRDFHVDALRLDAVHALVDDCPSGTSCPSCPTRSPRWPSELGRPLSLVAESDLNDPVTVTPTADGGWGMTAQWADDVHHAIHALVTGERHGLLRRLRRTRGAAQGADRRVRPRRRHVDVPRTRLGPPVPPGTDGHRFVVAASDARPGGQPRARRPPVRASRPRPGRRGGRARAARPVQPDAVHGRGVGRPHAVAVLHRPPRARPGRGRPCRPRAASSAATAGPSCTAATSRCPTRRTPRRSAPASSTAPSSTTPRTPSTPACATGTGR